MGSVKPGTQQVNSLLDNASANAVAHRNNPLLIKGLKILLWQ